MSNIKTKKFSNNKQYIKKDINYYLKYYKIEGMNDEQMNNLEYEIAVIIDKRTYFQYYFSLLKKNNYYYLHFILIMIII